MQAAAHQTRREPILGIPLAEDERVGSAAGISETAAEPGGALGIAPSGSVRVAIHRRAKADAVPNGGPLEAAQAAQDRAGRRR